MSDIKISDVTNSTNVDNGTGIFDKLIEAVEQRIERQFSDGRITGADFSTVYLGALQTVLQQAIQFTLAEEKAGLDADLVAEQVQLTIGQTAKAYAEVSLLAQKQETELRQTSDPTGGVMLGQLDLYRAQILGFEGKHKNELIKNMLDTWAVIYSITDGVIPTDVGTPDFLETASPGGNFTMPDLDIIVTESDALYD